LPGKDVAVHRQVIFRPGGLEYEIPREAENRNNKEYLQLLGGRQYYRNHDSLPLLYFLFGTRNAGVSPASAEGLGDPEPAFPAQNPLPKKDGHTCRPIMPSLPLLSTTVFCYHTPIAQ
jgi:hypothetical protein